MLTTAGSAGFKTAENPFAKLPKLTGNAFCVTSIGLLGAPKTVWSVQFLTPCESRAPPASATSSTTVATQLRIFNTLLSITVSLLCLLISSGACTAIRELLYWTYLADIGLSRAGGKSSAIPPSYIDAGIILEVTRQISIGYFLYFVQYAPCTWPILVAHMIATNRVVRRLTIYLESGFARHSPRLGPI